MTTQILIVEDEAVIALDLKNQLLSHGYEVTGIAPSYESALRKAEAQPPDLIMMDIMLKGQRDGIEAAQRLRESLDVPIVFLSAFSDNGTVARVKAVAAHGYLVKPFRSEELRTTIEVALVRHGLTKQLQRSEERVRTTLSAIGDAVVSVDTEGRVDYLNPVAESLTGWASEQAQGLIFDAVLELYDDASGKRIENPLARALTSGEVGTFPPGTSLKSRGGGSYPVEDACTPIVDSGGQMSGAVVVFRDVTGKREMLERITYQARHDALTSLVNRAEFELRLHQVFAQALETGQQHALLYLDLDQFKVVNDSCGHRAGDELLRRLADLMTHKLRKADMIARLGGDEFAVLLEDCPLERAQEIAAMLVYEIRSFRFQWAKQTFMVGASVGVVALPAQHPSVAEVLVAADTACYLAKESGRNRVQVYSPDDETVRQHRGQSNWVRRLAEALERDQFCLYAQRITPLQSPEDSVFYELLLRLKDPAGNLVAPMAFIPAAERFNLMPRLDRWVIQHVLSRLAQKASRGDTCYGINLSGASLSDPHLLEFITAALSESGVPARTLCFEITETAAVQHMQEARTLVKALRELGCRFALDDFGSGLSSFRYLKNFPVDFLKIDGYFVREIQQPLDQAMIESIQRIAHVLGVKTVAEYVEDPETLSRLYELGVDYAQGYGIHKPQALETVLRGETRRAN